MYGDSAQAEIAKLVSEHRFQSEATATRGFQGTESTDPNAESGPVQFEKGIEGITTNVPKGDDIFGLDRFLDQAKRGKRDKEGDSASSTEKRPRTSA